MGSGNALLYRFAPALTVALVGAVNKRYDANAEATLVDKNYTITGEVNADSRTLGRFEKGMFTSSGTAAAPQDAGAGKVVTVTGLTITAKTAGDERPVYGYRIISPAGQTLGDMRGFTAGAAIGSIDPAPLDLTLSKVYDGNAQIGPSNAYELTGMVAAELAPRITGGVANVASPRAGSYKSTYLELAAPTLTLSDPNYTLRGGSVDVTIQKAPLGVTAEGNYSGSTEIKPNTFTVVGLVANETLTDLEKFLVNVREVSANDVNFVTELVKSPGGGTADLANYRLTLAPNKEVGTTQNSVRIKSLSTLIVDVPAKPVIGASPRPESAAPPPSTTAVAASSPAATSAPPVEATAAAPVPSNTASPPATSSAPDIGVAPETGAPPAVASPATGTEGATGTQQAAGDTSTTARTEPASGSGQAAAGTGEGTSTTAAPAATAGANAPAATTRAPDLTPGVRVSVIAQPATGTAGLVAVVVPQGSTRAGSPVVLSLPETIMPQAPAGTSASMNATLTNDRPLPNWIRFDPQQKVLVIESTAATSLPVTVVLTIGGQQTSIVVTESTTTSR
jgi:hypothetical protein